MELLSTRRVYEGHVVNLRVDQIRFGDGKPYNVEVVEHAQAVVVIVRPEPDRMLLVRQYRHPVGREQWEVVAGGMNRGESPEEAARRELREETGYRAARVGRLWSAYSAPGFCDELLHFCVVDGFEIGESQPDTDEHIVPGVFALDALWKMIQDDQLPDAKTQVAVLWALGQHRRALH
jgi:ADP-ribose pyrophosphatase